MLLLRLAIVVVLRSTLTGTAENKSSVLVSGILSAAKTVAFTIVESYSMVSHVS